MAVQVLVTVDLNRVTDEQRKAFAAQMTKELWGKLSLTTAWKARFQAGVSEASALRVMHSDIRNAAASARITNFEYAAQAGIEEVAVFDSARQGVLR
jgi:hypothetical protein